jgi:hypothetical protein
MGTYHNALFCFWLILGNDIIAEQGSAVESLERSSLFRDLHAVALEFFHYPLSAQLMRLTVHSARSEVTLLLTEYKSRVGREVWSYDSFFLSQILVAIAAPHHQYGYGKEYVCLFHQFYVSVTVQR